MTRVAFICRGSTSDGLGHVMRCRTVAAEMKGAADVSVITLGDRDICATLLEPHVPFSYARNDADAGRTAAELGADVVVFDLLDFDREAFESIGDEATTVCLSPIFMHLEQVDLAFTRAASPIHERLMAAGRPVVRAGCQYTTISPHCRRVDTSDYRRGLSQDPLAVAISMGGGDAPNNTLRVLDAVRHVPASMLFWVMLGEGYTHSYERLVDCVRADGRHEIILAKTNNSMWRILSGCSVAVLAGGITTFEAAYAGIPSIITLSDARDRFLIRELIESGACRYAGAPLETALDGIVAALTGLDDYRDRLLTMHTRCKELLDNQGPSRVVREIVAFHRARVNEVELAPCTSV